jgi:hypothetical protein
MARTEQRLGGAMARYKVLPSIAHNFGQAFVGASNEREDDHLLGRLLADARRTGEATLRLDILTGVATPAALVSSSLARVLERHVRGFPDLVAGDHSDMHYIHGAWMELTFDLATERPVTGGGNQRESPFLCRVAIDDDKGKTWIAELRGWCAPPERTGLFARLRAAGRG